MKHRVLPDKLKQVFTLCERSASGLCRLGDPAGTQDRHGYWLVSYKKVRYMAHRVVYFIATGDDPGEYEIDHVDRNKSNNHITNLKLCTRQENVDNTVRKCNGVQLLPSGRYRARVSANNKRLHLGVFNTFEEAEAAYKLSKLSKTR